MGRIDTLLDVTASSSLPELIIYDYSDILGLILEWPTLRAFFDFSDLSTMTVASGAVVTVTDLTGNYVATADSGERAVYGATAINGQPGLTFDGTQRYNVPNLMGTDTQVTWAACAKPTATGSRMILADATTATQNLYSNGNNIAHFNGAAPLTVPDLVGRHVNVIWTMNYTTDAINVYADGLHSTGTSNRAIMSGAANIGAWNDGVTTNRFTGNLGYLAVFTEDASQNTALRNLLNEFKLRRWRA